MSSHGFTIHPFEPEHIEHGLQLTREVSWPHRGEDWHFAAALGEGVVARDVAGRVIGTALWWAFGPSAATIGFIVVAGAARGQGLGRALTDAVLAATGERAVMLTATEAGRPLYERLGFAAVGTVYQQQGVFAGGARCAIGRPARPEDLPALTALDAVGFGAPRGELIARLVEAGETRVIEENGAPVAFAVRRRFGRGEVIGPILARDEDEALALIDALSIPGFLRVDLSPEGLGLGPALAARGLERVDEPTVMVRGSWPAPSRQVRRLALVSHALC